MKAILSDIHANLEALEAVLADAQAQGAQEIYCLGDYVGMGVNPRECIDLVMGCKLSVLGDHDQAALFDPEGFTPVAEFMAFWTRSELESGDDPHREVRWLFLGDCRRLHKEGDVSYVHGSLRNPLNEYIHPEDAFNLRKMERNFDLVAKHCFHGHTHVPGVIVENRVGDYSFRSPEEIDNVYRLDGRKALINVGSVGLPGDADWRASYALFDGNQVRFRRVEYDIDTTIQKVRAIPNCGEHLAKLLRLGIGGDDEMTIGD